MACFEQVGPWLAWARQALAADDWDVRTVTEVLAALGVWVDDEDYPRQHVP